MSALKTRGGPRLLEVRTAHTCATGMMLAKLPYNRGPRTDVLTRPL
ncbi:hypothetical protein ACIBI4_18590 [Streptomyces sp. NPDC050418]